MDVQLQVSNYNLLQKDTYNILGFAYKRIAARWDYRRTGRK